MFTGIIETIGKISGIENKGKEIIFTLISNFNDLTIGESISVDGICLTITTCINNKFTVYTSTETLNLTILKHKRINDFVNLERSLKLSDRLSGHIVLGHVDCIGNIESIKKVENSKIFELKLQNLSCYIVYKSSIAINGVSLTINEIKKNNFFVNVIPHTLENTTFKYLKTKDNVNIEFDILAKYVESMILKKKENNLTEDHLKKLGF
jgi:riboflavin synthase